MNERIKYTLHDYIRSQKYFPPVAGFIILILVFYTYKPNPIIDSYAITALFIYIIAAWLSVSMLSLDSPVQKQLFILHIHSHHRYYISKLISIYLITILLSIYAFLYPIIFNMFDESVTLTVGIVSFLNHIILAILGVSIGSLFSKGIMNNPINSYGGLALVLVISIAALGIYDTLPSVIKHIVWIIPPAIMTQKPLIEWSGNSFMELTVFPFIWIIVYIFMTSYLFLTLSKR